MEIKTIVKRLDNAEEFDNKVNQAIAEGWTLTERKVLQPPAQPNTGSTYFHNMLYAELVKGDAPAEENPVADLIANLARFMGAMADKAEKDTEEASTPNNMKAYSDPEEHMSEGHPSEHSNWVPKE